MIALFSRTSFCCECICQRIFAKITTFIWQILNYIEVCFSVCGMYQFNIHSFEQLGILDSAAFNASIKMFFIAEMKIALTYRSTCFSNISYIPFGSYKIIVSYIFTAAWPESLCKKCAVRVVISPFCLICFRFGCMECYYHIVWINSFRIRYLIITHHVSIRN